MTTDQTLAQGATRLPSLALCGTVPQVPDAVFAFTDRGDGTMSSRVGDGDHRAARAALLAGLGAGVSDIAWMDQVHGREVAVVTGPTDSVPTCDGIASTAVGLGVAVLVADCVPVLLAGPHGVAAAHAGRLGLLADVTGHTVGQLQRVSQDAPSAMTAIIGPAIGACCYEVPPAMAEQSEQAIPGTGATTRWGTPSVDLVGGVVQQLQRRGVSRILRAGGCTLCGGTQWFSHRASTGEERRPAGRQAGVIARRRAPSEAPS